MLEFWQSSLIIAVLGTALTLAAHLVFRAWAPLVTNFQGRRVRTGYGVYVAAWAIAPAVAAVFTLATPAFLIIVLGFAVPGFLDDVLGAHGAGGFGGHLKALMRQRRVTTGLVKAGAGGAGAFVGLALFESCACFPWWDIAAGAAVIALSANFINLLDLRPGRAGWVSAALWAVLLCAATGRDLLFFLTVPAFVCLLVLLPADSRGTWIMGDSGSNVLGALLGLTLVLGTPPWTRWVGLAVLLAVHVFAERRSISRTIEATPALRWLDSRLGVR